LRISEGWLFAVSAVDWIVEGFFDFIFDDFIVNNLISAIFFD